MFERMGTLAGLAGAPAAYLGATLRHARLFHPKGATYQAQVTRVFASRTMATVPVGEWLSGPALVRFSTALRRKNMHGLDILGCAIRFGWSAASDDETWHPYQQDLLLATIRFPITIPGAFFTTNPEDFFANYYYGIGRFQIGDQRNVQKFRLRPAQRSQAGEDKFQRLEQAVLAHAATLFLELGRFGRWRPIARVVLEHAVRVDEQALRFSPYQDGRGIHPVGFINATRRATYLASQTARAEK